MLSIKHFACCGLDVHKKFVVATIAITDYYGVTSYILTCDVFDSEYCKSLLLKKLRIKQMTW